MSRAWVRRAVWLAAMAPAAVGAQPAPGAGRPPAALTAARQLVVVTAAGWDDTTATLRRYERAGPGAWRAVGDAVPVVLGRTGLAWGVGQGTAPAGASAKREGDGRSPAGAFPLLHVFGYESAAAGARAARLPFVDVNASTVCVDDPASPLYNAVVDSAGAGGARWGSAERMRRVAGYRLGAVVGYNGAWTRAGTVRVAPAAGRAPVRGRGSCIFLHVWDGPASPTEGCTAMDAAALGAVVAWLDAARRPALVQLTRGEYARLRRGWALP